MAAVAQEEAMIWDTMTYPDPLPETAAADSGELLV